MHFQFKTKTLADLYYEEKGAKHYPAAVVDAFYEVMAIIENARDERDLYAFKSLHFEQLQGARGSEGRRSIRLNQQYRLIVTIEQDAQDRFLLIVSLENHYR